jgi:hypothetical protein
VPAVSEQAAEEGSESTDLGVTAGGGGREATPETSSPTKLPASIAIALVSS